jgi:hypothetical protein
MYFVALDIVLSQFFVFNSSFTIASTLLMCKVLILPWHYLAIATSDR